MSIFLITYVLKSAFTESVLKWLWDLVPSWPERVPSKNKKKWAGFAKIKVLIERGSENDFKTY